jgi:hypothetical protein
MKTMSEDKIVSIFGGNVTVEEAPKQVYAGLVRRLEEILEEAKRGDIVGAGIVTLDPRNLAEYTLVGSIGGYGMLGALEMVKSHLIEINRGYTGDE